MDATIWKQYQETDEYRRLHEIFNNDTDNEMKVVKEILKFSHECAGTEYSDSEVSTYITIVQNFIQQEYEFDENSTREGHEDFFKNFEIFQMKTVLPGNNKIEFKPVKMLISAYDYAGKYNRLPYFSIFFYMHNSFYKPFLVGQSIDEFVGKCEALGINVPEVPDLEDDFGLCMWYYDLCDAINEFQMENDITDVDFCVALYGLAPKLPRHTKTLLS